MAGGDLLTASATELARRIRSGEVTSRQVVDAHIARIEAVNPTLNAVVAARFEQARAEADAADARVGQAGEGERLPPFLGVPCTIKECFGVTGMPQTSGLVAREGVTAMEDATTVRRLRDAGAIVMGVTNVSELCMWMESHNKVYGRTRNPYDPGRIVGGSSGGEGAIVGAGGSPFGLGSDVGGSIRMPAFFNGVFGHKPTGGMVPGTGQYPLAEGDALRYVTTGPLARRAEDLWPLLRTMAGPDGRDDGCRSWVMGDPEAVDVSGLEVFDVPDNGVVRVSADLRRAQQRVSEALRARGATVRRVRIPRLQRSLEIWSAMLSAAGGKSFEDLLGQGEPVAVGRELAKLAVGRSPYTLPALGLCLLERLPALLGDVSERFVREGRELRAQLEDLLGDRGVMLFPSYATPAPRHRQPLMPPFNWRYTAILNVMEVPVTQVPLGLNRRGLPLGVQVAAGHGRDDVTIAVARALEEDFGGWVLPDATFRGSRRRGMIRGR